MDLDKLENLHSRFVELEKLLADNEIISDQSQYQKLAKEYAEITPTVNTFVAYKESAKQMEDLNAMIKEHGDDEMGALAKEELAELEPKVSELETKLNDLLNPKKQHKDRDLIIEIRAGTGGQEAAIFAGDLYRMYSKYAEKNGWKVEPIDMHESESGGFKEVIFSVSGSGAEKHLQFESGGHRVQRVPETEASGRIHTSAATVAVLFEPEEVEIEIKQEDLRIDIFRSSGPGGQSVNTTDSAVRISHLPSGIVVSCQDERSQLKNKHKAMRVLRARLHDHIQQENEAKASADRKLKVGSGDRSEKIRTYNYPDRRVTDHRIGFTLHKLNMIMDGDLDELTEALIKADEEETLNEAA